jgi:hypothetical protein
MESDKRSLKRQCEKVLGESWRQHKKRVSVNTVEKLDIIRPRGCLIGAGIGYRWIGHRKNIQPSIRK